jgi:lipoprotein NlpI/transglutaminase-like putative cysteine protease
LAPHWRRSHHGLFSGDTLTPNRSLRAAALFISLAFCLSMVCTAAVDPAPAPSKPRAAASAVGGKAASGNGKAPASAKAASTAADKSAGYRIEPAPSWVVAAVEKPDVSVEKSPLHYRIIDEQIQLEASSQTLYSRSVRVPTESAGLAQASQIAVEFDPGFQTLAVHHLVVVRNGERLDRLGTARIELLHRETQMERQMVDGRVTLAVVVDDVRVGDEVDFAYSVRGANPVFGGQFVHNAWMSSPLGPIALYQLRVVAPASRTIYRLLGAADMKLSERSDGGRRETLIRREAVAQFRSDAQSSGDVGVAQAVQFSEFADWSAVAHWGSQLFAVATTAPVGPLLLQKAAEIKSRATSRDATIRAALDFVQKEIRYFATEIGPSSHQPASPEQVLKQRFGDCKDKVGTLVALLRQLDIAAAPVLVSTSLHDSVASMLPSALAFDHVIARIASTDAGDGSPLFLDATRLHQTGDPARRQAIGLGKGLLLADDTRALLDLPSAFDSERMTVRDLIRVRAFRVDPTLEARVTYRGDLADYVREAIAHRGIQDAATEIAAAYIRVYPKAKSISPASAELGEHDDSVTVVLNFAVPDFWRFQDQRFLAADIVHWSLMDALSHPKSESRRDALGFALPGIYRQRIAIEYPSEVFSAPREQNAEDGDSHVNLKAVINNTLSRIEYGTELRIGVDRVKPDEWTAYSAKLGQLLPRLVSWTGLPALSTTQIDALSAEFKATDEKIKNKTITVKTEVQTQALFKAIGLSAQIAAGRLPPALEAQALTQRGIQYDHLGRVAEARADFDRALELAPDVADTLSAAAVNRMLAGDLAASIALSTQVLARSTSDAQALNNRAVARYLGGDFAGARSDLETALKDSAAARRGYPLIWLALTLRSAGADPASLAASYGPERLSSDWPRPLVDFALGRGSKDEVLRAAKTGAGNAGKLSEAYFYLGEKALADGKAQAARGFWQLTVDQGVVEFVEDGAARWRLKGPLGH